MKQNKKEQLWKNKIKSCDKSYLPGFDGMFYKQKANKKDWPMEIHFKFTNKYRIYLDILHKNIGKFEYDFKKFSRVKVFDATNQISLKNEPVFKVNIKYNFNRLTDICEILKYL